VESIRRITSEVMSVAEEIAFKRLFHLDGVVRLFKGEKHGRPLMGDSGKANAGEAKEEPENPCYPEEDAQDRSHHPQSEEYDDIRGEERTREPEDTAEEEAENCPS
jgi:hypothetical protein